MSETKVIILHFEDQPAHGSWLLEALHVHMVDLLDDEAVLNSLDIEQSQDEHFTTLKYNNGSFDLIIEHYICTSEEEFAKKLEDTTPDLVIFDTLVDGKMTKGADLYKKFSDQIDDNKLWFLTAIPNIICQEVGIEHDDPRLITKPPNIDDLTKRLFDDYVQGVMMSA